jgi:Restriction endonuclease
LPLLFDDSYWQSIRGAFEVSRAITDVFKVQANITDVFKVQANIADVIKLHFNMSDVIREHFRSISEISKLPVFTDEFVQSYLHELQVDLEREPDEHEVIEHPETELVLPETRDRIVVYSPSILLLEKLRARNMSLFDLEWRQLEEIVAELLTQDGYTVQLGRGTKDGGKDIVAMKSFPGVGLIMSVWQAKNLEPKNKVGLRVIRELADTRVEHKASKGVIVTTTSLTRDALKRVERDSYWLHKVDGTDLDAWIRTGHQP